MQRWQVAVLSAQAAVCIYLIIRRKRAQLLAPPPSEPKQEQSAAKPAGFGKLGGGKMKAAVKRMQTHRRIVIAANTDGTNSSTSQALLEVFKKRADGNGLMNKEAFVAACEKDLCFNMTHAELARVFQWATSKSGANGAKGLIDGTMFVQCVRQRLFLTSVSSMAQKSSFEIPANLDYDKDTASNYDGGPGTPFLGPYKDTRATRDHAYHGRYTEARQKWQDGALEMIVQRSEPQPQPWLVFTCGGMGVGKGYALGWLSEQGIFPLEDIVHIDPDYFKSQLPEVSGAYLPHLEISVPREEHPPQLHPPTAIRVPCSIKRLRAQGC